MTIEEKLKMYREKKQFVYNIAMAFVKSPKGHSIEDITYEVWHKEHEQFGHDFVEWIIVHFDGGAISPIHVSGNSNTANFRAIGKIIDGGYYEDVMRYETTQVELGYKKVDMTKMLLQHVD